MARLSDRAQQRPRLAALTRIQLTMIPAASLPR